MDDRSALRWTDLGTKLEHKCHQGQTGELLQELQATGSPVLRTAHLSDLEMDDENETLTVKVNDAFAEQSFTPQVVEDIYAKIKEVLPSPYDDYFLRVETHNYEIQEPFPTV